MRFFSPQTEIEERFAAALRDLHRFPIRDFDARFTNADAQRIAAGTTFLGIKRPTGRETMIPEAVLEVWRAGPALQARHPRPESLLDLESGVAGNFLSWCRDEGRGRHAAIAAWLDGITPFDQGNPFGRE